MENTKTKKYFKPAIEDIHIGYEVEDHEWSMDERGVPELNYDRWVPKKLQKNYVSTIIQYGVNGIRVPYLTKEQIRDNGWMEIKPYLDIKDTTIFEKGNYLLVANFSNQVPFLDFMFRDPSKEERVINPERFRFFCDCKDINTLRVIEKLLNITNG